jgi:hypothetical protein
LVACVRSGIDVGTDTPCRRSFDGAGAGPAADRFGRGGGRHLVRRRTGTAPAPCELLMAAVVAKELPEGTARQSLCALESL